MASVPSEPRPIVGRIDMAGRLIAADPELEALQRQAGASLGQRLALPQVAAVAELARKLGIAVHHRPRLLPAQVLRLVAGRARLPMPRRPGMAKVVKPEVLDLRRLQCIVPSRIGHFCPYGPARSAGIAHA